MAEKKKDIEAETKEKVQSSKLVKPVMNGQKPAASNELKPVEHLAKEKNIKTWELAGLMRAAGWAPGKQVAEGEFDLALNKFRRRPQGGGKLSSAFNLKTL